MEQWEQEFFAMYPHATFQKEGKMRIMATNQFQLKTQGTEEMGMLFIRFLNYRYDFELIKMVTGYWEAYAKVHDLKMIFIHHDFIYQHNVLLNRLEYQKAKLLNEHVGVGSYFKQLAKGSQKQIHRKTKRIMNYLETIKQKEPTFIVRSGENAIVSHLTYYYKGDTGTIKTTYHRNKLYLSLEGGKEKYEADTEEQVQVAFEKIFEKMEQKVRIRNQLTPPRKFYDEEMKKVIDKIPVREDIYQLLRNKFSWEEIENYFANIRKKTKTVKKMERFFQTLAIVEIMDVYFFIEKEKTRCFMTGEEAKEAYQNALFEQIKKDTETEFQKRFT